MTATAMRPALLADEVTRPTGDYDVAHWHRLHRLVGEMSLPENFRVVIGQDPLVDGGKFYLQVAAQRIDVITGEMGEGRGGKSRPSVHACDSEIVGATFGLYKSYVEHEARETFEFVGRRVFGPHIDVWALWEAAAPLDRPGLLPNAATQEQALRILVDEITLADPLRLVVGQDPAAEGGKFYLQVVDTTGALVPGDPYYPAKDASATKVLSKAFDLYRTYVEDQARRTFVFRDRAVYDPDVDAYALWSVAPRTDFRQPPTPGKETS